MALHKSLLDLSELAPHCPVSYTHLRAHETRMFISDRHKIRSRRVTGLTPQQQRQVATAVKNAREMALLPFTTR